MPFGPLTHETQKGTYGPRMADPERMTHQELGQLLTRYALELDRQGRSAAVPVMLEAGRRLVSLPAAPKPA